MSTSHTIDEIGKGGLLKWRRYAEILLKTINKCIKQKPDLVYMTLSTTAPGLFKDALVVFIVKFLGYRIVFHLHNKGVKKNSGKFIEKQLYPRIFKNTDVILLSPYLYEDISKYVNKGRVKYCGNGIEENIDINKIRSKPRTEQINLLFLSNLLKTKGIWDLLKSCIILKENGLKFQCIIAGAEGDVTALELTNFVKENGLDKEIRYVGKVSGDAKNKVFEEADIFIHPTQEDCFPLVLLEAMQYSLPVISTFEGAIPEIIINNETGIIVKKESPKEISEAVNFLENNPKKRIQMGVNAFARFKENYTLSIFEDRLISTLSSLKID
ncbi:glycosyltransferase family 4 protein [Algoriphagus sp.]|uniref:glycosyltransferase family 4 protein n=1 Tax=Algoriphagus sp. TaxID=1872435 RepID=UPI0025F31938|nr:glycosyltransferase family 4 protein [Algoriphagus sp.]